MSTNAKKIAHWADKLRDLSAFGMHFTKDEYDRQRYQSIQEVALQMMAAATDTPMEIMEPLRDTVFSRPTPLSTGDAAIIDHERILLIRRADNGLWAMPGGALEVGETAAQGVCREAFEETGLLCTAVSLAGVFDSRLWGSTSRHHLYHYVFICRPLSDQSLENPSINEEALEARWYPFDHLPPASEFDPGHARRVPRVIRVWRNQEDPYFDP